MSVDSLIFWLFVAAWILLIALIVVGPLARMVAEVKRIIGHVVAFVGGSELPLKIAKAEADLARIDASIAAASTLAMRAEAALLVIRTTPIVPPQIAPFVARMRLEIAAFRSAAG